MNAYEVKPGIGVTAGETVRFMPERLHHQSELVGDVAVPVSVRQAVLF